MDSILILDFGGQTTQLIGRRIRDSGVYSEIVPGNSKMEDVLHPNVKGIILSGSPYSVWEKNCPSPDSKFFHCGLPVLGICYGFHQITVQNGGEVKTLEHREYGRARVHVLKKKEESRSRLLFDRIPDSFLSWMSHSDSVLKLGQDYQIIAESENGLPSAAMHKEKPIWGVQFHPETSHCEYGNVLLENFAVKICGASRDWSLETYIENSIKDIRAKVGTRDVLLLISGGVDSTVAAALLLKALHPEKIWLMYIDNGLMRKGETEEVSVNLQKLGAHNLLLIKAQNRFLEALAGVQDPEKKRKIIGDTFVRVQSEETKNLVPDNYILAQGTLYTDIIESGRGVGEKAQVIKSHHNVGTPLIEALRTSGNLVEPLDKLYKDEVRRLGKLLGVKNQIISRHPFPGPGLGVRIISDITESKLNILREADAIYIEELRNRELYNQIWQAFSVLLPIRSVGVTGDKRDYGYVLSLRAVISVDGMSADVFEFPTKDLLEISARITNSVKEIGRVVYDVSSKPPATIEWE